MLNASGIVPAVRRRAKSALRTLRSRSFPPAIRQIWIKIREEHLSYTEDAQILQLISAVTATAPSNALIIETGCARGGSSILMCAMKSNKRPMRVYDVFEMLPPPSDQDGADMQTRYAEIKSGTAVGLGGTKYYLYEDDLQKVVAENFQRFGFPINENNVQLIKGKVQDTLVVSEPVALANIDVDWYEPVSACIERIMPNLIVGGSVAVRAYNDWSGARKAVDDYFRKVDRQNFTFDSTAGHMFITRIR